MSPVSLFSVQSVPKLKSLAEWEAADYRNPALPSSSQRGLPPMNLECLGDTNVITSLALFVD